MCQRQREKSWIEKKWKIFENYDVGKDNSVMLLTNTNYEKLKNKIKDSTNGDYQNSINFLPNFQITLGQRNASWYFVVGKK